MNATPDEPDSHQTDADQTAKDRSYSPASERETEAKQEDTASAESLRPGTGGPDDVGDIPLPPEDDLDPADIIKRGDPGHE
jgi:hypothetical protein